MQLKRIFLYVFKLMCPVEYQSKLVKVLRFRGNYDIDLIGFAILFCFYNQPFRGRQVKRTFLIDIVIIQMGKTYLAKALVFGICSFVCRSVVSEQDSYLM